MSETYEPGELFVYVNGDRWELGQVKRPNNTGTGYFCWYSTGGTCANTPLERMHKLANAGSSHIERGGADDWCELVELPGSLYAVECSECGAVMGTWDREYEVSRIVRCSGCGRWVRP